jgi:hypothetical protein
MQPICEMLGGQIAALVGGRLSDQHNPSSFRRNRNDSRNRAALDGDVDQVLDAGLSYDGSRFRH